MCTAAGLTVPPPQAAFYLYPDFEPWRDHLRARHQVATSAALARLLLDRHGAATLPASAFGEHPRALRLRLATGLLYGDSQHQREAALTAPDPLTLPWIATALTRLEDILTDLASPALSHIGSPAAATMSGLAARDLRARAHKAPWIALHPAPAASTPLGGGRPRGDRINPGYTGQAAGREEHIAQSRARHPRGGGDPAQTHQ